MTVPAARGVREAERLLDNTDLEWDLDEANLPSKLALLYWRPRRRGYACVRCDDALDDAGGVANDVLLRALRERVSNLPPEWSLDPPDLTSLAWDARPRDVNAEPWAHLPTAVEVVAR